MICFQEVARSGFGDRLRGIAHLIEAAARRGETEVLYNDDGAVNDQAYRWSAFPGRMTDMIRIEGLTWRYHALPLPPSAQHVVYDSASAHVGRSHPAARQFHRIGPADPAVTARVDALDLDRSWVALHVRQTDNVALNEVFFDEDYESRALENLRTCAPRFRRRRVFLASDNAVSLADWRERLEAEGFEVRTSDPVFDTEKLRQTGLDDMLVDFFALSRCRRVVRTVPSEFSRFAAWVGGRRLRYRDLK